MKIYAKDKSTFMAAKLKAGYSSSQLGDKVSVTRQAIHSIETGKRSVSPALSKNLCQAMHVEFDDIFKLVEK